MIYINTLLLISTCVFFIIALFSIIGVFKAEYKIRKLLESNINFQEFYEILYDRVNDMFSKLKDLDREGHFNADDEVGFFFNELKEIINRLEKYVK